MKMKNNESTRQFVKFLAVGVMNTLVTLVVIYLCSTLTAMPPMLGNAIGYIAGLINSFLWNRKWVFRASSGNSLAQAVRFAAGFGLCYGLQFAVVWSLMQLNGLATLSFTMAGIEITGYAVATLAGMGVYTVANFIFNRLITFSK